MLLSIVMTVPMASDPKEYSLLISKIFREGEYRHANVEFRIAARMTFVMESLIISASLPIVNNY